MKLVLVLLCALILTPVFSQYSSSSDSVNKYINRESVKQGNRETEKLKEAISMPGDTGTADGDLDSVMIGNTDILKTESRSESSLFKLDLFKWRIPATSDFSSGMKNEYKLRWRAKDMLNEYLMGTGIGVVGGLLGGALGSIAHIPGDTSKSGSNTSRKIVLITMSIGHIIGTPLGINNSGKNRDVQGEPFLAALGTILMDVTGMILANNDNKWLGLGTIVFISPLISTILYNLAGK